MSALAAAAASDPAPPTTLAGLRAALKAEGLKPKGRTKAVLEARLARARRALAVLTEEDAAAAAAAAAAGSPRPGRYDAARAGRTGGARLDACRLCHGPIAAPRRTFCCDECVHFHTLRTSGRAVRAALLVRDGGVCALCGVDAGAAHKGAAAAVAEAVRSWDSAAVPKRTKAEAARTALGLHLGIAAPVFAPHARIGTSTRYPRPSKGSFWQADHIVAVSEGGGSCGLSNFRTLCVPCHAAVTASQSASRAAGRRDAKALKAAFGSDSGSEDTASDDDGGREEGAPGVSASAAAAAAPAAAASEVISIGSDSEDSSSSASVVDLTSTGEL